MSKTLIDAAASYFGMDPAQLANGAMSTNSEGLRFTFTVQCSDEDYLGIADRMRAMREPVDLEQAQDETFISLPTLQEVMRDPVAYMFRPECKDLVSRACALSQEARMQVETKISMLGDEGMQRRFDAMSGVGGRDVKHVDAPAGEDSGLPAAVWVRGLELTQAQRDMASDRRGDGGHEWQYLIQVAMLTPEQRIRLAVKP